MVEEIEDDPINDWGMMYRTQFLVLDRTMLEAMPNEWQRRFVSLMDEIENQFDFSSDEWRTLKYLVKPKVNGKFVTNPWGPYRYPNHKYVESVRKKK